MYNKLGPDTGYDCISNYAPADQLTNMLDAINENGGLPKTILYSLNPGDDELIVQYLDVSKTVMRLERFNRISMVVQRQ